MPRVLHFSAIHVLGSEAHGKNILVGCYIGLIKDFVLSVWEERKVRLYGKHANVHRLILRMTLGI